jgi:hypothetical protein
MNAATKQSNPLCLTEIEYHSLSPELRATAKSTTRGFEIQGPQGQINVEIVREWHTVPFKYCGRAAEVRIVYLMGRMFGIQWRVGNGAEDWKFYDRAKCSTAALNSLNALIAEATEQ